MQSFEELRREIVEDRALEGINRYNPANLDKLEDYVQAQGRDNEYDCEANLTLLKLYQLNPSIQDSENQTIERINYEIVAQILLKTLMVLPASDFVLAKCLLDLPRKDPNQDINEMMRLHPNDLVNDVLNLGDMVEACDFVAMWHFLGDKPHVLQGVTGFEDAMRKFVCHTVNITFQNIEIVLLQSFLGEVSEERLAVYAREHEWTVLPKEGKVLIHNHEATVKTKNIEEKLDMNHLREILRAEG